MAIGVAPGDFVAASQTREGLRQQVGGGDRLVVLEPALAHGSGINPDGGLVKSGAGHFATLGTNTYSGATIVSNGTDQASWIHDALVVVASGHRGDAFAACEFIMDYLKTQAPFWKKEQTPEGARWVDARESDDRAAQRWSCWRSARCASSISR